MYKKKGEFLINLTACSIIFIVIILFFSRLFFPELNFFISPDYGLGDIWYFNFPIKQILAQSYKSGEMPLWNKDLGTGFPLLAEGQIGYFYIPNLLFLLLDFPIAFNLEYFLAFFMAAIGMFFYSQELKFSKPISVYTALILTLSGYFIIQISHLNLLQAASLIPLILMFFEKLWNEQKLSNVAVLSFLISQQYFAGYAQISFITIFLVIIYFISKLIIYKKQKGFNLNFILFFIITLFFAASLSAVQFLPSNELLHTSIRQNGLSLQGATSFSFPPSHFLTFLDPFIRGNPKNGTYNDIIKGIYFWENIAYVGSLPLLLLFFSYINHKRRYLFFSFLLIFILSALLMMGKYSPLYFVALFPPFNLFRVPSRFLLSFLFSLIIISAIGLEQIYISISNNPRCSKIGTFLLVTIIASSVIHLFLVWFNYQPVVPVSKWLEAPETAQYISKKSPSGRVFTLDDGKLWTNYYINIGWKDNQNLDAYFYFRNALVPNSTTIYNIRHYGIYVGAIETKRMNYFNSLLSKTIEVGALNKISTESALLNLLSMSNIQFLTSTADISKNSVLSKKVDVKSTQDDLSKISVYENKNVLPRAHLVLKYLKSDTLEDIQQHLLSPKFNPEEYVILEKDVDIETNTNDYIKNNRSIKWVIDKNHEILLDVKTERKSILVLADTFYPGWKAFINGKKVDILPANLNQRAILINPGHQKVRFIYEPISYRIGGVISATMHVIVLLMMFPNLFLIFRKVGRLSLLYLHR